MNKLIKVASIISIVIISNFAILITKVKALENNQQIEIFTTGNLSRILKFVGTLIKDSTCGI